MSYTKRQADGSYHLISGHARLQAMIDSRGQAEVVDADTLKPLVVREVNGQMLAMDAEAQANLDDLAAAVINRARHGAGKN